MGASSGHHVLSLRSVVIVFFNEQDNLQVFLSKNKSIES